MRGKGARPPRRCSTCALRFRIATAPVSAELTHCRAAGDQCIGNLRDMQALKAGDGELVFAWLA